MLSIIADALMTATRQDQRHLHQNRHADHFIPEKRRQADSQARSHNPYSYFQ